MTQLGDLQQRAAKAGLDFLLIGGWAVCEHGYARQTKDFDFLTRKEDRGAWDKILKDAGYTEFSQSNAFSQWEPPADSVAMRVDFMYVNESTFAKMWNAALPRTVEGAAVRIPSLDHLFALKLHALRYTHSRRELKDMTDVVYLLEANAIDVKSENFRNLCMEFGTAEIYERLAGKKW